MKQRYVKGLIEKSAGGYRVLASTDAIDRQGDVIEQNGWVLGNFMKNPVMLWAHDYSSLPVARVTGFPTDARGLVAEYEFAPGDANPMAAQIKTLVDEGFINAVSVGFIPLERTGNKITKSELLEISFVPVPANQEALTLAHQKGISQEAIDKFLVDEKDKGAVADELAEEEAMEEKWEKLQEVFEVMNALIDVYLDPDMAPEAFSDLLREAIGLLQQLADNGGADDDTSGPQIAAYKESLVKTIAKFALKSDHPTALNRLIEKLFIKAGARHSAKTKEELQAVMDLMMQGHDKLKALVGQQETTTGQGGSADDSEPGGNDTQTGDKGAKKEDTPPTPPDPTPAPAPVSVPSESTTGEAELRALLITRGMLRNEEKTHRTALSALNALIEARR